MPHKLVHYFVEGECEKKLIDAFKIEPYNVFLPGKVSVFNFLKEKITPNRLMMLERNTIIILVYDIDILETEILEKNIMTLKLYGFKEIYHIQSIRNFEDEIVYSCNISNINEVFKTAGTKEFKSNFIRHKDIVNKLNSCQFNADKIWSRVNDISPFKKYSNEDKIKYIKTCKQNKKALITIK